MTDVWLFFFLSARARAMHAYARICDTWVSVTAGKHRPTIHSYVSQYYVLLFLLPLSSPFGFGVWNCFENNQLVPQAQLPSLSMQPNATVLFKNFSVCSVVLTSTNSDMVCATRERVATKHTQKKTRVLVYWCKRARSFFYTLYAFEWYCCIIALPP